MASAIAADSLTAEHKTVLRLIAEALPDGLTKDTASEILDGLDLALPEGLSTVEAASCRLGPTNASQMPRMFQRMMQ
jgi:hypothetical protein